MRWLLQLVVVGEGVLVMALDHTPWARLDLVLKKWTVGLSGKGCLWRAVVMLLKLNRGEEIERRM